jgi:hypothetical protein
VGRRDYECTLADEMQLNWRPALRIISETSKLGFPVHKVQSAVVIAILAVSAASSP